MTTPRRYTAAIGMFDGVHLGHRYLLYELAAIAAANGTEPLALTFEHHPQHLITGLAQPPLLTDAHFRSELIREHSSIDSVKVLPLTREDLRMPALDFIDRLKNEYGVVALLLGFNNHIGSDRRDGTWLAAHCTSMPVFIASRRPGDEINSSKIRTLITNGQLAEAAQLLGRPYSLRGRVVHGKQLGRTIGFPTANILPVESAQLLPPDGVYAVDVEITGKTWRGMANIGSRPTFEDGTKRTIEVNIFDFDADLYDQIIAVRFLRFLRHEQKFDSPDALRTALLADREEAKNV